ncbi:uncharacterized protein LOC114817976 [Ornithorhynchus anatinus]|uniref:uncharacterized protein LOC114817976 n=1 Tax=Ornithorhynchus anatinus TaxID=9258 RepID=UPI0010A777EF|nr:uncharacterized protein LOC114817976 [Ornithorhynchus anatinus]
MAGEATLARHIFLDLEGGPSLNVSIRGGRFRWVALMPQEAKEDGWVATWWCPFSLTRKAPWDDFRGESLICFFPQGFPPGWFRGRRAWKQHWRPASLLSLPVRYQPGDVRGFLGWESGGRKGKVSESDFRVVERGETFGVPQMSRITRLYQARESFDSEPPQHLPMRSLANPIAEKDESVSPVSSRSPNLSWWWWRQARENFPGSRALGVNPGRHLASRTRSFRPGSFWGLWALGYFPHDSCQAHLEEAEGCVPDQVWFGFQIPLSLSILPACSPAGRIVAHFHQRTVTVWGEECVCFGGGVGGKE